MRDSGEYISEGTDETKIVAILIGVSIFVHLAVLVLDTSSLFKRDKAPIEEMVISADIFPDVDLGGATKDALPEVEKAKELKVERQILPQLPKKFKIEEKAAEKDGMTVEEVVKPKPKKKPIDKPKEKEIKVVKKQQKDATELKKRDALARLLKEQARKEKKFADKTVAPLSKKLAQRKMELENSQSGASGGGGSSKAAFNRYGSILNKAIHRNYSLPEVYNLADADLTAKLRIVLNASGELRDLEISTSSGDSSFDQLALKTVRDSVPFPKPPAGLAGESFILVFNP